jgi:hypothetical protein
MQDSALLKKLNRVLTGRFSPRRTRREGTRDLCQGLEAHGRFLKEGAITDLEHREALARLRASNRPHPERRDDVAGRLSPA